MLYVKTYVGPSAGKGNGLFATEKIPKGTIVCRYTPEYDLRLSEAQLNGLPCIAAKTWRHYCYRSKKNGDFILPFDNARFFNHSDTPNCIDGEANDVDDIPDIAARDIEAGEELTVDYRVYDEDYDFKMSH